MKNINTNFTFYYNWNQVSIAHWLKYPNPYNKSIEAIDILERKVNADGTLYTKRLITTNTCAPIPSKIRKYFNIDKFYIIEETIVDNKNKVFKIDSYSISYPKLIQSREFVEYKQNNVNPSITDMKQDINISINIYNYFEEKAANIIKRNIHDGRRGMNYILKNISNNSIKK